MGNILNFKPSITINDVEAFKKSSIIDDYEELQMDVECNGELSFYGDELESQFADPDSLAMNLAPFASKGDTLEIQDTDDPSNWAYEFDGVGGVYEVVYIKKRGKKLI